MTTLDCGQQAETSSPAVSHLELPISGAHVVVTRRSGRVTLEVLDAAGQLLGVVSDSPLDPSVLRGSWRGAREGRPWALAVGRSVPGPITVTFHSGHALARHRVDVTPSACGDFWVAEIAGPANRVTVAVDGSAAGSSSLQAVA